MCPRPSSDQDGALAQVPSILQLFRDTVRRHGRRTLTEPAAWRPASESAERGRNRRPDNRRRHCGIYALCDWLAGSDIQWLYGVTEDNAYYSHDHGYYLTGPTWTEASLAAARDVPFALSIPPDHLDQEELARLADALEGLTREGIEAELSKLPDDWPVTDAELDAAADFADHRRGPVASRLRAIVA